jgi:carbamoyl-phosphate synthase large subunit
MIKNGEVSLIINTVDRKPSAMRDSYSIRHAALQGRVTYYTTLAGARAACVGMQHLTDLQVYDVQTQHKRMS